MDQNMYEYEIVEMAASLGEADRRKFMTVLQSQSKNPVVMYGCNIWLGWFGIDRFMLGNFLLGFLKLITFGGLGLWVVIDCFSIGRRTREKNIEIAQYIYDSLLERQSAKD